MKQYSKKNRQAQDKYYTKPEVAKECYEILKKHLNGDYVIIEPAAGDGKLMDVVDNTEVYGFDLFPEREDIVKNDFLENPNVPYEVETTKTKVTFANPPFGNKGVMCKVFMDEALKHSDVAGFIVPNSFRKNCKKYNILDYKQLPLDGFTYGDSEYEVNCWFVVITNDKVKSKETTESYFKEELEHTADDKHPDFYYYDFLKVELEFFINKIRTEYEL